MSTSPRPPSRDPELSFLADGGEMGAAVRAHDWSSSPLGPPERWPQSLRTAVGIMLSSKFPMFLAWGPELTFLYNDGYIDVLGGKHPALGKPFQEIWSEIWGDIKPLIDKAMAGEATYWENLPLTMRRKGYEEQTWFTFSYSPIRSEGGNVEGMFCACIETTEKVRAEKRRASELERLRQLFDRAPGFIAVLRGPDHVFELANASYRKLVGRDVLGKTAREAVPEVEGQGIFDLLDQVYAGGEPFTGHGVRIELERTPGEPEERLLDFVYQPIAGPGGAVEGIFVEGYDVTERERAQLRLRESEQRFRLIADSAPVPMWVTKLDRKRSFVNRAYIEFLGITYDEAVDFDWRSILHPDDTDRIVAESIAGEASLKPFVLEARYRRADGEWRWIRSISQPRWGGAGAHEGFIGVAVDITDSKLGEEALRELNETLEGRVAERTADLSAALDRLQAEIGERTKAEEALRQAQKMEAIGQLTGGIAHDFNNLLTPVVGGLELIARSIDDSRLRRIAEGALESSRRGAKLTGQLLAFSRLQRIRMVPVPVNRVIEEMSRIVGHTIGSAVEIRTELDPAAGHAVCDENQLENAILNLAINARDAMPDGGTLTISTAATAQPDSPDLPAGNYVCIAVADTGQGMSEEVVARAVEPFFSTKPLGKGTGLGLAQVYGIARQSGGTVRIESAEGRGTTVRILLPRTDAPAIDAGGADGRLADTVDQGRAAGARILVVDDDEDVRQFIAGTLESLGHRVRASASAEEGLEAIARELPELLLVDFAMPGTNGAQMARAARERHPELPVVFVTGFAESEQIEAALGHDVPILRKPFGIDELAATVAAALRERRSA